MKRICRAYVKRMWSVSEMLMNSRRERLINIKQSIGILKNSNISSNYPFRIKIFPEINSRFRGNDKIRYLDTYMEL